MPTVRDIDNSPEVGADPEFLCANWRKGCNGVTNGPEGGYLTLCDDCASTFAVLQQ